MALLLDPDDPPPSLRPGIVIAGKYEVIRLIGQGGMGLVYEAQHLRLNHRVAIKVVSDEVSHLPEVVRRFDQEARAAVQLRGRHVAKVFDVDSMEGGAPFMVMEYLEGRDLSDEIFARGTLPVGEAVRYLLDACEAMAEAHELGIVHRDLKPANLFLTAGESGVVKVLDFGISKWTKDADAIVTTSQAILGSPQYMSPEQVRSTEPVDARSDIWALGVILFEMLAGEPPFQGKVPSAIIAAIVADAPRSLAELRPDLPEALTVAVMKTLQKEPDDRFASVKELADAIRPFASLQRGRALRWSSPPAERGLLRIPSPVRGVSHTARTLAAPQNTPTAEERPIGGARDAADPARRSGMTRRRTVTTWLLASGATIMVGIAVAAGADSRARPAAVDPAPAEAAATEPAASSAALESRPVDVPLPGVPVMPSASANGDEARSSVPPAKTLRSTSTMGARGGRTPAPLHERPKLAAPEPVPATPVTPSAAPAPAASTNRRVFRTRF